MLQWWFVRGECRWCNGEHVSLFLVAKKRYFITNFMVALTRWFKGVALWELMVFVQQKVELSVVQCFLEKTHVGVTVVG